MRLPCHAPTKPPRSTRPAYRMHPRRNTSDRTAPLGVAVSLDGRRRQRMSIVLDPVFYCQGLGTRSISFSNQTTSGGHQHPRARLLFPRARRSACRSSGRYGHSHAHPQQHALEGVATYSGAGVSFENAPSSSDTKSWQTRSETQGRLSQISVGDVLRGYYADPSRRGNEQNVSCPYHSLSLGTVCL